MTILTGQNRDKNAKTATIGFFDGVHSGHRYLLDMLKKDALENGIASMAVTFKNHPRLFFDPDCDLKYLTLPEEKSEIFNDMNIDYCLMLDFSKEIASLTSRQFMQFLHEEYGVIHLLIGYDHRFGSDKEYQLSDYEQYGKEIGIDVIKCGEHIEHHKEVSSSKIRKALSTCNITDANILLGYRYALRGKVIGGHKLGRTIGFPTANIETSPYKLIPANGVYAVNVIFCGTRYWGMLNIGNRPTVDGGTQSIEVNIFDFEGDIYGEELTIEFVDFVRAEQKFDTIEELRQQLFADKNTVLALKDRITTY